MTEAERQEQESFDELWSWLVEIAETLKEIDPPRRHLWIAQVIEDLWEEQEGLCALCGEELGEVWEVDHKIPFCYGGGNEHANIQIACRICNRKKRNMVDPTDLRKYLEDRVVNIP